MNKKYLLLLIGLCLILITANCLVKSRNPLGPPEDSIIPPGILGLWENIPDVKDSDEKGYLLVLRDSETTVQLILFNDRYSNDDSDIFRGFFTTINDQMFLNLKSLHITDDDVNAENPYEYLPIHIDLQKKSLAISLFDTDFIDKAIENGEITGLEKESDFTGTVITETTEKLAAFIEKHNVTDLVDHENGLLFKRAKNFKNKPVK